MQVGFSGSRKGPTPAQLDSTKRTLSALKTCAIKKHPDVHPYFRHGDCIGWDAVAHDIADELGYSIVTHPPSNPALRAFKPSLVVMPPKDYLPRNRDIVDESDTMVICPDSFEYRLKSGTWYTWKYAIERGVPCHLILPDGRVTFEVGNKPRLC